MSKPERRRTGGGLWLGAIVSALVAGAFAVLVAVPSLTPGDNVREVETEAPASDRIALTDLAPDPRTRTFFNTLDATFPSAADELRLALIAAEARGADEAEKSLIILKAGFDPVMGSLDRLSRADIRFANEILSLTRTRLEALDASGAPYCQGSDLVEYAGLAEQELYRTVFDHIEPGDPLYVYMLDVTGLLLDAIRDARAYPKQYAGPSRSDLGALQTLGLSMLTDADITRLLTTEGKSRSEMDEVLDEVNFCELGTRVIGRVERLPEETKSRLWYEGLRQLRINGIRRVIWMISTY